LTTNPEYGILYREETMDPREDGTDANDDLTDQNLDGGEEGDLEDDDPGAETNDSSDPSDLADEGDSDLDGLFADVEDLRDFKSRTDRTLGHVAANQREIAKLTEASTSVSDELADLRAQNETLIDMLEQIAPDTEGISALRKRQSEAQMRQQVAEQVAKARGEDTTETTSTGPATDGPWGQANIAVHAYAQGKGVDADTIPAEVWANAQASNDPDAAQRILRAEIDKLAGDGGESPKRRRRGERKAAGGNQKTVERGGNGGSGLTLEALSQMSQAEILKLDKAEVDRVISGG
jgi:Skp family chaperone for outer membrane proteins